MVAPFACPPPKQQTQANPNNTKQSQTIDAGHYFARLYDFC
jgi:hypothetical protein